MCTKDIVALCYMRETGGSQFAVLNSSGEFLMLKAFPSEPYLDCTMNEPVIMLRGKTSLYCWSVR